MTSAGCASILGPSLAHTVNVYNEDYEDSEYEPHTVTVIVQNGDGDVLYNRTYHFDADDLADEQGQFPVGTSPETVVVVLDGREFTYDWPSPECGDQTRTGVEISVSNDENDPISVDGICETETVEP